MKLISLRNVWFFVVTIIFINIYLFLMTLNYKGGGIELQSTHISQREKMFFQILNHAGKIKFLANDFIFYLLCSKGRISKVGT